MQDVYNFRENKRNPGKKRARFSGFLLILVCFKEKENSAILKKSKNQLNPTFKKHTDISVSFKKNRDIR